jgi:outer membrane protein assembly factor BamB
MAAERIPPMHTLAAVAAFSAASLLAPDSSLEAAPDSVWPQFRGPRASGVAEGEAPPSSWSATENVVWSVPVPGRGWSSPIVWGERLYLTAVVNEGEDVEPRKGLYFGGNRDEPPETEHRWVVLCFETRKGRVLWEKLAHRGRPAGPLHIKNTYASETPVSDGERVYAYFGNLGIFAYDRDGNELWSRKLGSYKTRYGWGTAASPALHGDRLFIVHDNEESSFIIALDKRSGEPLWRRAREEKSNWATPFVWENSLRTEVVTSGSGKVRSYDLDGMLLWELRGMSTITIPTPQAAHGLLYVGSGYVMDKLRPIYAIRPGASGDISLEEGAAGSAHIAWRQPSAAPYNPSPLVHGDHLYVLFDRGFFACHDARSGREVYGKQRLSDEAQAFTASPWAHGGNIFCLSEDGDAFVIEPGPEFRVLEKNSLGEMCMATPAVAGGSLYIRTLTRLYRIAGSESPGK